MSDGIPLASNPQWMNWTRDLVHIPTRSGANYYFAPTTQEELRNIVLKAKLAGVNIRVSGQRHSQPPLVVSDNRVSQSYNSDQWLVDLSCYADLGPSGNEPIIVDKEQNTVTVNTGVREDYLDAFLSTQALILETVTAGGFFSIGGMTAVDVHGATVGAGIFSETVVRFTIMNAEGIVHTVDEETAAQHGWKAIQFARVSLGALGIVTAVTIKVKPRPYATTLSGELLESTLTSKADFIARFQEILTGEACYQRIESFFNPYDHTFLMLCWRLLDQPPEETPNKTSNDVPSACNYASQDSYGAPYESKIVEHISDTLIYDLQFSKSTFTAKETIFAAYDQIKKQFLAAKKNYSDLWLTKAARVSFNSYFIPISQIDEAGLGVAWDALQVVPRQLAKTDDFRLVGPMEFRFVKGGNTAMAGTWADEADQETWFVNIDAIGFVHPTDASEYRGELLNFFAAIEREWYGSFGGIPHNGKMYGFYNPEDDSGYTPPFNKSFLADLAQRRGDRLKAFEAYRQQQDPDGRFLNEFLRSLGLGSSES